MEQGLWAALWLVKLSHELLKPPCHCWHHEVSLRTTSRSNVCSYWQMIVMGFFHMEGSWLRSWSSLQRHPPILCTNLFLKSAPSPLDDVSLNGASSDLYYVFELKLHTLNLQSSFVLANVRSAPYCAKFAFYARSVQFPGPVLHWTSQFCTGFAAFPVLHWSTFVALTPWSWTWCSTGSAVQLLHPLLAGNIHWEWWWWWWRQWRWWWLWWLWWQWWWWWFSAL